MEAHKCPFSAPLVTHQFGCPRAQEVVRRGGAEIDCNEAAACARCTRLFERLKAAALPAFGVEDDLLSMPHSVRVKIQHGGLLGLQRRLTGTAGERVDDIDRLVAEVEARYGESIPVAEVVEDITAYKPRGRRGR
jgi:hypothetical protein